MTADEIIAQIKPFGTDAYKKIIMKHGAKEPVFGVKIEELKKIQKRVKKDYQLALDLFDSGIYDARYLAGLIADDMKMTRRDLQHWAKTANSSILSECTVPWVAAEGKHGHELALEWIDSAKESIATSGWATLSSLVSLKNDAELDMEELKALLQRVQNGIHQQPNRVRYTMNSFVIHTGCHVQSLTASALQTGAAIGVVDVDMGDTSCKLPDVAEYIRKAEKRCAIGKKKKTVKC